MRAAWLASVVAAGLACNGGDADATASTASTGTTSPTSSTGATASTSSTTAEPADSTTGSSTTSTTDADTTTSSTSSTTIDSSSSTTAPAPFCGDGQQDPGEACDDGNDIDDDACSNACVSKFCAPSGQRAALDTLGKNGASGCWDGNPCGQDQYNFLPANAQNFQAFGESISCTGAPTCVAHVGLGTYEDSYICQGRWDVLCDDVLLGTIDTLGRPCVGSAMANGCSLAFEPRVCAQIELRAAPDGDATFKCCEGSGPDSMIVAVSAW